MHELFHKLADLRLPQGDYAVFGSGPLVIRGVIEATNDLDVLCRGEAWEAVCQLAPPRIVEPWNVELVSLYEDRLTFGRSWAIGEVDPDQIIETAEIIAGLPFARLEHVIAYKRCSDRAKDREHLRALGLYQREATEAEESSG